MDALSYILIAGMLFLSFTGGLALAAGIFAVRRIQG